MQNSTLYRLYIFPGMMVTCVTMVRWLSGRPPGVVLKPLMANTLASTLDWESNKKLSSRDIWWVSIYITQCTCYFSLKIILAHSEWPKTLAVFHSVTDPQLHINQHSISSFQTARGGAESTSGRWIPVQSWGIHWQSITVAWKHCCTQCWHRSHIQPVELSKGTGSCGTDLKKRNTLDRHPRCRKSSCWVTVNRRGHCTPCGLVGMGYCFHHPMW